MRASAWGKLALDQASPSFRPFTLAFVKRPMFQVSKVQVNEITDLVLNDTIGVFDFDSFGRTEALIWEPQEKQHDWDRQHDIAPGTPAMLVVVVATAVHRGPNKKDPNRSEAQKKKTTPEHIGVKKMGENEVKRFLVIEHDCDEAQ